MAQTHNFLTSNSVGGIGEALFISLMGKIRKDVKNVSSTRSWQKRGIDFVVDGIFYDTKFDLKASSTGNMAIEVVSRQKDGVVHKKGWLHTTEADCIVYIFKEDLTWKMYFFTQEQLSELEREYKDNIKEVANYGYKSKVVLVPLEALNNKQTLDIPIVGNPPRESLSFLRKVHKYLKENKAD